MHGKTEQPHFAVLYSGGGAHSKLGMSTGHTFNPGTWEAEAGGPLCPVETILLINAGRQDRGKGSWLGGRLLAF